MKKRAAVLAVVALTVAGCGGVEADAETVRLAQLKAGWVADVAHDPRQDVDEEPANQCAAYREGDADHFVELDPEGNFIRSA